MILVSIPTGPTLDGHDFAVQAFGHGVGYPVTTVGDDIIQVRLDHLGDFFDRFYAGMSSPGVPLLEKVSC